jgi:3'-phosphoadenosine 5'-phosphosulfate sulfotransferase (PAPS reductase)/FAD synthetase
MSAQIELFELPKITRILVSVSGGRTSGYMAWWLLHNRATVAAQLEIATHELEYIFVFANTGMEHDETLRFMRDTDRHFSLNCTWLEGVTQFGRRVSTQFRVTDVDRAYRHEQYQHPDHPMHQHIVKYGVPNVSYKNCTRELKRNTINNWMLSQGLSERRDFYTAIGIRHDEKRRCAKNPAARNIIYPLVDWHPVNEQQVIDWWQSFDWDLTIPRHLGNCITCFEKCESNLQKAWMDMPSAFDYNVYMEKQYAGVGPEFIKYDDAVPRAFFRGRTHASDLIAKFALKVCT